MKTTSRHSGFSSTLYILQMVASILTPRSSSRTCEFQFSRRSCRSLLLSSRLPLATSCSWISCCANACAWSLRLARFAMTLMFRSHVAAGASAVVLAALLVPAASLQAPRQTQQNQGSWGRGAEGVLSWIVAVGGGVAAAYSAAMLFLGKSFVACGSGPAPTPCAACCVCEGATLPPLPFPPAIRAATVDLAAGECQPCSCCASWMWPNFVGLLAWLPLSALAMYLLVLDSSRAFAAVFVAVSGALLLLHAVVLILYRRRPEPLPALTADQEHPRQQLLLVSPGGGGGGGVYAAPVGGALAQAARSIWTVFLRAHGPDAECRTLTCYACCVHACSKPMQQAQAKPVRLQSRAWARTAGMAAGTRLPTHRPLACRPPPTLVLRNCVERTRAPAVERTRGLTTPLAVPTVPKRWP